MSSVWQIQVQIDTDSVREGCTDDYIEWCLARLCGLVVRQSLIAFPDSIVTICGGDERLIRARHPDGVDASGLSHGDVERVIGDLVDIELDEGKWIVGDHPVW
jgi:hypothetical protein